MKKIINSDPRITAKKTSWLQYLAYVVTATAMSTGFLLICTTMMQNSDNVWFIIAAAFTYLCVVNGVVVFIRYFVRTRYLTKPMQRLSNAARKVVAGDFSVRIDPIRKDKRKDEFEVLFDDFNTMATELQSVEILKNNFVSNVSHELKTPLAVIQNYATMLQSDGISETERKEYSNKIVNASVNLTALVTNILQLSRLENQKIYADIKPYNLSEQLCGCLLNFEHILDERQIELLTELDDTIILNSDEKLLDIVWNNLLSNAMKFTDEGGAVHVKVQQQNGYAVVSVADNGCGMTEEEQRHIFDKFYQADTSHATKGNGLGLALVRQIVELLNGKVEVKSAVEKGSEFVVKFKIV